MTETGGSSFDEGMHVFRYAELEKRASLLEVENAALLGALAARAQLRGASEDGADTEAGIPRIDEDESIAEFNTQFPIAVEPKSGKEAGKPNKFKAVGKLAMNLQATSPAAPKKPTTPLASARQFAAEKEKEKQMISLLAGDLIRLRLDGSYVFADASLVPEVMTACVSLRRRGVQGDGAGGRVAADGGGGAGRGREHPRVAHRGRRIPPLLPPQLPVLVTTPAHRLCSRLDHRSAF